ncbi:hypothetical protein [Mucilaginibacter sp. BT774]|uniref:hypothetical protein n=1 Tax=Mucilaginibacter sp. BT774 TaxID=3062276 RepID=UPI002676163D|nr:hypothetical protein [Mucilaginibacter sp. BT774]MDO3626429.1 hypothetical protein [Mucilaginibacter sp. BT774]
MVNPVNYQLHTSTGECLITIEPVYEEIAGGDLFATGRYILIDRGTTIGEIRVDGESVECEWNSEDILADENVHRIVEFIREYNEPELAGYLD